MSGDLWETIQQAVTDIRFADIAHQESRRTLLCHPGEADRIRWFIDQHNVAAVLTVHESVFVPAGQMYVIDEQTLEAGMRETFSKVRPHLM